MKICDFIGVLCIASFIIGFALLAIVQQRHTSRHGLFYRSIFIKLDADNLRLLKIGIPVVAIGVILLITVNLLKP